MRAMLAVVAGTVLAAGCSTTASQASRDGPARHLEAESVVYGVPVPTEATPNAVVLTPAQIANARHRAAQARQRPTTPAAPPPVVHTPAPAPPPSRPARPDPPTRERGGGGQYDGSVPDMIRAAFPASEEARALCTAHRESRFNPHAVNPRSGAAGVFQWMPRLWPWFASRAGWGGASVFSARANVAVAAWQVTRGGGWWPWGGGCI